MTRPMSPIDIDGNDDAAMEARMQELSKLQLAASTAPLADLAHITFSEMKPLGKHYDHYLLARAFRCEKLGSGHAVSVWLEDTMGNKGMGTGINPDCLRPAEHVFADRTILAIKEPFSLCNPKEKSYMVRLDHVSDIVVLEPDDERVPEAWADTGDWASTEKMKEKGDGLYGNGKLWEALQCYDTGIRAARKSSSDDDEQLSLAMQAERSQMYLTLGLFESALEDAEAYLLKKPKDENVLARRALALYKLRRYEDSVSRLEDLLSQYPENKLAKIVQMRCVVRLEEQQLGKYDWAVMKRTADRTRTGPADMDNADYIGPVRVGDGNEKTAAPGKRGLFATRDIAPGELLVCQKAFCIIPASKLNANKLANMRVNSADLKGDVIAKFSRTPSSAKDFLETWTGKDYKNPGIRYVDDKLVVDSNHIEEAIVSQPPWQMFHDLYEDPQASQQRVNGVGLFLTPSHLNHSCYHNAQRSYIGDLVIIRAAGTIKNGSEVTIGYRNPTGGYPVRKNALNQYGIDCNCTICAIEAAEPASVHINRQQLVANVSTIATGRMLNETNRKRIHQILDDLEKTYTHPTTVQPRILLGEALNKEMEFLARFQHQQMTRGIEVPKALLHENCLRWFKALDFDIAVGRNQKKAIERLEVVRHGLFINENVVEGIAFMGKRAQTKGMQVCCRDVARGFYEIVAGEGTTVEAAMKKYMGGW